MAAAKEQLNILIPKDIKQRAKTCAVAHNESLNTWVIDAIRQKAARDFKKYRLDKMRAALGKVLKQYLPGKIASKEEMLETARLVAAADTEDGLEVEYYDESSQPAVATRTRAARTRR